MKYFWNVLALLLFAWPAAIISYFWTAFRAGWEGGERLYWDHLNQTEDKCEELMNRSGEAGP